MGQLLLGGGGVGIEFRVVKLLSFSLRISGGWLFDGSGTSRGGGLMVVGLRFGFGSDGLRFRSDGLMD